MRRQMSGHYRILASCTYQDLVLAVNLEKWSKSIVEVVDQTTTKLELRRAAFIFALEHTFEGEEEGRSILLLINHILW
jgi:hypothetical protein